ncbi:unnamed protein product [Ostreobium quekettii]|uniref:RING-type E3 ubiquitin transferase n=1 Tax=Ostreobium quekettii TaxID=121088 RepID=A0A8S1J3M1_9CHLO|nr:unnamed protein product [Ostreobium quekettii]|eukprot:evm.model.scf_1369.5 EVM.evm.TU.scf_1369.5   scf_1369:33469-40220(-)
MPLALQAALGFVQAIHYSARAASVNRECCCTLSRLVGRVRPLLEEVEFESKHDATGMRDVALESIATALEKAHVAVVRFSTMGSLQAILETEAMMSQFQMVCYELDASLTALRGAQTAAPSAWKEDLQRLSEQLQSISFDSCTENSKVLRQLHQEVTRLKGLPTGSKVVYSRICNLLWKCQLPDKLDMLAELQGLRRELSRAKAEKDLAEEFVLQQVIKALQSSAAIPYTPSTAGPQPPVEYCCPISHQIMREPVVLVETGQTYDLKCIQEWFGRGNATCPVTGQKVGSTQLTPNFALKSLASAWVQVHGYEQVGDEEGATVVGLASNSAVDNGKGTSTMAEGALEGADADDAKAEGMLERVSDCKMNGDRGWGVGMGASNAQLHTNEQSDAPDGSSGKGQGKASRGAQQRGNTQTVGTGDQNASLSPDVPESGRTTKHTELLNRVKDLLNKCKERRSSMGTPDYTRIDQRSAPEGRSAVHQGLPVKQTMTFSKPGKSSGSDSEPAFEHMGASGSEGESLTTSPEAFEYRGGVGLGGACGSSMSDPPTVLGQIASFPVSMSTDSDTSSGEDDQGSTSGSEYYPELCMPDESAMTTMQSDIAEEQGSGPASMVESPSQQECMTAGTRSLAELAAAADIGLAGMAGMPSVPRLDLAPVCETRAQSVPPPKDMSWVHPGPTGRTTPDFSNRSAMLDDMPSRRPASALGLRCDLEQSAGGYAGHSRGYSWSGGNHDPAHAFSKFLEAKQAAVSTQGRLQLLAMTLNKSRQQMDFLTPRSGRRSAGSEGHLTGRAALAEESAGTPEMLIEGPVACVSPSRALLADVTSVNADVSNAIRRGMDENDDVVHGQAETGIGDPLSRWLDVNPETLLSDDEFGEEESTASESVSLNVSQLLQCPFTKDLEDYESMTGSGNLQSTEWDGTSMASDDVADGEGEDDSAVASDEENSAPSEGRHSISSLTTVASGGCEIVPVTMTPIRGSKRTNSPFPTHGMSPGSPDLGLDGETDKAANHTTPVLLKLLASGSIEVAMATAVELAERAKKKPSVRRQLSQSGMIPSLVHMLQSPKRDVRIASARALALLGDSSTDLQLEIIAAGAVPLLSRLTRAGSRKSGEAAGWAMNRLTANPVPGSSVASNDVSVPLLVDLLCTGEPDMRASAVLELSRNVSRTFGGYEEVGRPAVVEALVDLLSNEISAVHRAAGDLLASLLYKNKGALQVLAQKDGIVRQLLGVIRNASNDGKTAAAQVLKTLADVSRKIQQDIVDCKGVSTLATFLKVALPGCGGREACAWMLGSLACYSGAAREQVMQSGATADLEALLEDGEAEEKTAAAWSLRQLSQGDNDNVTSLPLPLIVRSLESGTPEVQVVAACELCHFASGSFWTHLELFHADAVSALLGFLRSRGPLEGLNAALAALQHLGKALDTVPTEICQQGGIEVLVDILREDGAADAKLVTELLSFLGERCPMHQQEIVSAGAVPLLVAMLPKGDSYCAAAKDLLMGLVDSELSAISLAVSHTAIPLLLELIKSGGHMHSREAAVALINRMVEINIDNRQTVVQSGGTPILLQVVNHGESHELRSVAANAMTKLAACNGNVQESLVGSGAFGSLVQLLESTSTRIRQQAAERARARAMGRDDGKETPRLELAQKELLVSARGRKGRALSTIEETEPLAVAPSSAKLRAKAMNRTASGCADDGAKAVGGCTTCNGEQNSADGNSGLDSRSVGPNPQNIAGQTRDGVGDGLGQGADGRAEDGPEHHHGEGSPVHQKGGAVSDLVDALRCGDGQEAATAALRSLAVGDKAKRMEMLTAGTVPLLVEILQSKSYQ